MNYIYIGEIVNTHGIKGELRIVSDFKYKNEVFKKDFILYVGKRKELVVLNSYRPHKQYDMVTFKGVDTINDAIPYKTDSIYAKREDIKIDGYLNEDLIGLKVYHNDKLLGKVLDVIPSNASDLLLINSRNKNQYIPLVDEFIKDVNLEDKKIKVELIKGLLNED